MGWGLVRHTAAAAMACSLLAGCWWTQPGAGPEQTRHNPFERELTADTVAGLTEQWSVQVPGAVAEPATSRTLLYAARQHQIDRSILALDVDSGAAAWEQTLASAVGTDVLSATLVGGRLWAAHVARSPFANPLCADIVRLDPATGEVLDTTATELPTTSFTAAGSIVAYIDTRRCSFPIDADARLVVRDRQTADILWTANLGGTEVTRPPIISDGRILASMPGAGTAVFDAAGCGAPECAPMATVPRDISMASDGRAFRFENQNIELPPPEPSLRAGAVEVVSVDSGEELWRADYGDLDGGPQGWVNGIAVRDDTLYVSGYTFTYGAPSMTATLAAYPVAGCGQPVCAPSWTAPDDPLARETAVAGDVVYTLGPQAIAAYPADGCGSSTCAPLVTVPVAPASGTRRLLVSAGHVFLVTRTNEGQSGMATTITAYGLS